MSDGLSDATSDATNDGASNGASAAPTHTGDLAAIQAWEQGINLGPVSKGLRSLGKTRAFAAVYRRLGPKIDPKLLRSERGRAVLRLYGLPGALLTTTGAKSGQQRQSPLIYVRDRDDFVVVGTNFGQPKHPGWTANLRAHPQATLQIGPTAIAVTATQVDPAEFSTIWPKFVDVYPGYANYLVRRGGLLPRMFRLAPS